MINTFLSDEFVGMAKEKEQTYRGRFKELQSVNEKHSSKKSRLVKDIVDCIKGSQGHFDEDYSDGDSIVAAKNNRKKMSISPIPFKIKMNKSKLRSASNVSNPNFEHSCDKTSHTLGLKTLKNTSQDGRRDSAKTIQAQSKNSKPSSVLSSQTNLYMLSRDLSPVPDQQFPHINMNVNIPLYQDEPEVKFNKNFFLDNKVFYKVLNNKYSFIKKNSLNILPKK